VLNWDAVGATAELLGALAVIVTLVYLARQVRHSAEQTRLSGVQAIQAANDRAYDPIYSPEMMSIWNRGHDDREGLSEADRRIFDLLLARLIASYISTAYQHERGAYDDEMMATATTFLASILGTPGGRSWYEKSGVRIGTSAKRLLDTELQISVSDATDTRPAA
jgi:hypothetical protein